MHASLRTFSVFALLVLTVAFVFWDLRSDVRDPNTINFYTMQLSPDFDHYFLPLIERFEAENPGYTINWVDNPYDGYDSRIITSMLGRNPPDVINLSWDGLSNYAEWGTLVPLADHLPQEVIDAYVPRLLEEGCMVDGVVYALPWYSSAGATLFNRAILDAAGISEDEVPLYFDDIPEFARRIRDNTNYTAFFPTMTDGGAIRSMMAERGAPFLNEEQTRVAFNRPEGAAVLEFYKTLYDERLIPREVITAVHRRPVELFTAGQLALYTGGAEFIVRIRENAPSIYENLVVRPKLTWRGHPVYFVNTHVLTVSNRSANPTKAAEFAAFVTNAENMLNFSKEVTIFPSITEAFEDPWFSEPDGTPEGLARYHGAQQVAQGSLLQTPPESARIYRILDEMVEQVLQGRSTIPDAMDSAEIRINAILEEALNL